MAKRATYRIVWNSTKTCYEINTQTREEAVCNPVDFEGNAWHVWLEQVSSFAFQSKEHGHFTALKERRARGDGYWIAYRSIAGKRKKRYLGSSSQLTLAKLEQIASALAEAQTSSLSLAHDRQDNSDERQDDKQQELVPSLLSDQLLSTKFFVPSSLHALVPRPRLTRLLDEVTHYPLTLISAPTGFGKTTLVASWIASLPAGQPHVAWVSLDEGDNDAGLFWTYVLTALDMQQPGLCTTLLGSLREQPAPPWRSVLTGLINCLTHSTEQFVLVLEDYHEITEQDIHSALSYLVEHLPAQLHLILTTRADPPIPLALLRTRGKLLEIRAEQLRCTIEESRAFLSQVMGIELPLKTIQDVTAHMEGWLVGLQLFGLSLKGHADPLNLLVEDVSGSQRYILDYLTEEVLCQQPQDVQTFLLSTSILDHLTASLCDAVMQQSESQQMLERLEHANLFVISLDNQRRWYRYHHLFAEVLRYRLEHSMHDLVPVLHHRASLWYAEHNHTTEAILHAFSAHEWQWANELIKRLLFSSIWEIREHEVVRLRQWLDELPEDVVRSNPHLCLVCAQMMYTVTPPDRLESWLDMAEATITSTLNKQIPAGASSTTASPTATSTTALATTTQAQQEQLWLLGEVIATRAYLRSYREDGQDALSLCQQALALLPAQDIIIRAQVLLAQAKIYLYTSANDAAQAYQNALQASLLVHEVGNIGLETFYKGIAAFSLVAMGRLHETQQLTQQVIEQRKETGEILLPEVSWSYTFQADIQREWNQLDTAQNLALQAIALGKQTGSFYFSLLGYAVLGRIYLSRGDLDAVQTALQNFERVGRNTNPYLYARMRAFFTTVDQVRLWLARGELESALHWVESLDEGIRYGSPFALEREEVARVRILLATHQPELALTRLKPVLLRATAGKRWNHVVEMRLLQTLALQMCHQEPRALQILAETVQLAEPEGYIRRFVDEGPQMEELLTMLRAQYQLHNQRPTPYLDRILAAFPQPDQTQTGKSAQAQQGTLPQPLFDPLSRRELEVLHLLASGESNQKIADELILSKNTVKRHMSNIFGKLGVENRVQATIVARSLGLLTD
jgi:ATP-dependent transcriptional regulator